MARFSRRGLFGLLAGAAAAPMLGPLAKAAEVVAPAEVSLVSHEVSVVDEVAKVSVRIGRGTTTLSGFVKEGGQWVRKVASFGPDYEGPRELVLGKAGVTVWGVQVESEGGWSSPPEMHGPLVIAPFNRDLGT